MLLKIGKIVLVLAVLIAIGYWVSLVDSEVILEKPWLKENGG